MSIRVPLAVEEFYHIYNRGADKRKIFLTKKDHERFLALLYVANSSENVRLDNLGRNEQGQTLLKEALEQKRGELLVSIGAYCLMPNHFHILIKQQTEGGITRFMQKVSTAYTMYFNKRYNRSGVLFQGKFKSLHVGNDRHLKYLLSYIHLNPSSLFDLDSFTYSSYADFAKGDRLETRILDKGILPDYFPTQKEFKKEMQEWLEYRNEVEQGKTLLK